MIGVLYETDNPRKVMAHGSCSECGCAREECECRDAIYPKIAKVWQNDLGLTQRQIAPAIGLLKHVILTPQNAEALVRQAANWMILRKIWKQDTNIEELIQVVKKILEVENLRIL